MSFLKGGAAALSALLGSVAYADETPASASPIPAPTAQTTPAGQTVGEIMKGSATIVHSHVSLYKEGTRVVSSSEKALDYAREHAVLSSGQAIAQAMADVKAHSGGWAGNVKEAGKSGVETAARVYRGGTEITQAGLALTSGAVNAEWDYGASAMREAWQCCLKGSVAISERTAEDWKALKALPGYKGLGTDFGNLYELTDKALKDISPHIENDWGKAFAEARADFNEAYRQSGTREDSLSALPDLMVGYAKAIYSGVAKPASRSATQVAAASTRVAAEAVFLPVAGAFMLSGRTIESTGLSLYYGTSMGIKIVSPTVEGGLLIGVAMLSYGSTLPTAAAGYTAGAVNEIAVVPAAAVAGTGVAAGQTAVDTGRYAAQVSYDLGKGTTKVAINQAQTGVVLGYNALTAIPGHLVMGVGDALVLAKEGSTLVVKTIEGKVQWSGGNSGQASVPIGSLPVGSVVDLDALKKQPGVQVRTLSDDPELAQKVLQKLPEDLHEGGRP